MNKTQKHFQDLVLLIRTLRGDNGCPWDKKQTIETLKTYLHQEFQELTEALDKNSLEKTREEMGDLLFILLFISEIAREQGEFSIEDVLEQVKEKMIGRHPHVFGDVNTNDVSEIRKNWKEIKAREKLLASRKTLMEKIPRHLPALLQAYWVSGRINKMSNGKRPPRETVEKITQEMEELKKKLADENSEPAKERLGDLLFSLVNLSRRLNVNPEALLRAAIQRFLREDSSSEK